MNNNRTETLADPLDDDGNTSGNEGVTGSGNNSGSQWNKAASFKQYR
jgi:hypothetical protein